MRLGWGGVDPAPGRGPPQVRGRRESAARLDSARVLAVYVMCGLAGLCDGRGSRRALSCFPDGTVLARPSRQAPCGVYAPPWPGRSAPLPSTDRAGLGARLLSISSPSCYSLDCGTELGMAEAACK